MNGTSTASPAELRDALAAEVRRFAGDDPGRSVAVATIDPPPLRAEVAADVPRPGGSVLKLLPAIALYRAAGRGEIELDTTIPLSALGTTRYPSILAAFDGQRGLSLREVCALSLITSDNPAAQYVMDVVGPERIGEVTTELGLTVTTLRAGFHDHELGAPNRQNVTTANEVLRLVTFVEAAPDLGDLRRVLVNYLRNQRIPARLDDDVPVMHKTGSLESVANDAGIVYTPAGRVALAYLCDQQPDTVLTSVAIADSALRVTQLLEPPRDR